MKLSIIIPYYNLKPYTDELLDCLEPQITDDVEVLVVDDGSKIPYKTKYKWVEIIRKENGGVSSARNLGIEKARGEYISFIDADDLVAVDYVKQILDKIDTEHFDYLEMSWKSLAGGAQWSQKLNSIKDSLPNPSVCTRVFKKSFIGDVRFNEKKFSTEDDEFKRKLYYYIGENTKKAVITDYLYFYRTAVEDSKSKRFLKGELPTKRIIYYFNHITADMKYLIDEVAKEDELNEVWVLTNQNDIPELEYYAHVKKPFRVAGMELRGEPYNNFTLIPQALFTQVAIWTNKTLEIGGIESFIYNFCVSLKNDYDITVLYGDMSDKQRYRLEEHVEVVKNNPKRTVICDTLIVNRLKDTIPSNIKAKRVIQMCHTCVRDDMHIPQDRDEIVCVSDASKESFAEEAKDSIVLHNLFVKPKITKPLLLVSATRLDTKDKGQKRMLKLAREMNNRGIPFVWLYFSNVKLDNTPPNMVCMPPTLDVVNYISMADYLVQLSSSESFCYSIIESLTCGVPVLCTDLPVLSELNIKDGENAYVFPLEMDEPYDIDRIFKNQLKGTFKYDYDNKKIIKQWKKILGNTKPTGRYNPSATPRVMVKVNVKYNDLVLNRILYPNDILMMKTERAYYLQNTKKFVTVVDDGKLM